MKLWRDRYDLTLDEVSLMFERGDFRTLSRSRWMPAWFIRRRQALFALEFSEMFNRNEVNDLIDSDITRLKIINRVNNILHPLYMGLLMSNKDEFKKIYYDTFGRPYNSADDLKAIISEIERLQGKIKELGSPAQNVQNRASISFEEVIAYIEAILDRSIDRGMKLYQFKFQYDLAVKRARELDRINK